jgi:hypothetical protein
MHCRRCPHRTTSIPTAPLVSVVVVVTAKALASLASLLTAVPMMMAFAISNATARVVPKSRLPPRAPEIVGVVIVGLVLSTTELLPVVPFDKSLAAG